MHLYVIPNHPDDRWSAAALDVTLNQMMGPIVKEMKMAASLAAGQKERNRRETAEKGKPQERESLRRRT